MIRIQGLEIVKHKTKFRVVAADGERFPADDFDEADFISRGLDGEVERREVFYSEWEPIANSKQREQTNQALRKLRKRLAG